MSARVSSGRGTSTQTYATPEDFMKAVRKRFGTIHVDVAASSENAKAKVFYDEEQDGLVKDWHKLGGGGTRRCLLWCNPPFAHLDRWAKKCAEEAALGAEILLLAPVCVTNWFMEHAAARDIDLYLLHGRLSFDGVDDYPRDCMLIHYRRGVAARRTFVWSWKKDTVIEL